MSTDHPLGRLADNLAGRARLSADDRAAILALPVIRRTMQPSAYLIREGEKATTCAVIVDGFAYRQKLAGDGARQILAIHLPGEVLDFQNLFLTHSDHNVQALTLLDLAVIPMPALRELVQARPAIAAAVCHNILVAAAISREWLLNNGRRNARTRLAHLLCEFATRLDAQELGSATGSYELPMTQEQIGDALGLTSVHINRSLRALERDGLIERHGRMVTFPSIAALRAVGDFSALYLHLPEER